MKAMLVRGLGLALMLSFAAHAQSLPRPKEFYFDQDEATTGPVVAIEGSDEPTHARLMQMIERGQRDADRAAAQLAHAAMRTGRTETGIALYQRALDDAAQRSALRKAIHWNYGWDLLRSGDAEAALEQWLAAVSGRLAGPEWLPPTLAMVLWRLERHDEARDWYAAAVRTYPQRWRDPGDFSALLPGWQDDERATLAEVHAAWRENPPAWP
ncbi:tetratricopeptide repeat protein [Luteimonas sp. RD2P54]|uniref:Tetratricopeptide repeat protein n=1 Tax=Luteimonas endophytica TaxID=3042023 RepID=A0ABT6J4T4_9GAMM|nr:tetratricopeptide repeat protein [Luteimonas endophytica]MDH5821820.1 tetratricopeptide repeat protein [Luteimonas endophytica]